MEIHVNLPINKGHRHQQLDTGSVVNFATPLKLQIQL